MARQRAAIPGLHKPGGTRKDPSSGPSVEVDAGDHKPGDSVLILHHNEHRYVLVTGVCGPRSHIPSKRHQGGLDDESRVCRTGVEAQHVTYSDGSKDLPVLAGRADLQSRGYAESLDGGRAVYDRLAGPDDERSFGPNAGLFEPPEQGPREEGSL